MEKRILMMVRPTLAKVLVRRFTYTLQINQRSHVSRLTEYFG